MSGWDQYITNLTSQGITHAGIFGNDGSKWAASPNFPVRLCFILNLTMSIFSSRVSITLKMNYPKCFQHNHQAL